MDKQTELVEKLSAQIVQWETEIDRLRCQAETAQGQEREACLEKIEALERKRAEARATLQGTGTENADALDDMKKGSRGVLDNVKSGLRHAILKIK